MYINNRTSMININLTFFVLAAALCHASAFRTLNPSRTIRARNLQRVFADVADTKITAKEERRRILKSENYNRMGFKDSKEEVRAMMGTEYTSPLIAELRANGGQVQRGELTIKLAEYYGFCWGVERAVAMAYEARSHFPTEDIYITNEIIHNPEVNDRLHDMSVKFIEKTGNGNDKDFSGVRKGDVVILPAFGATIDEMKMLDERGAKIVDTTCPWVSKVWNAVDNHRRAGQTSVIHGKWAHEETVATASFCEEYIIVKDKKEAQYVIDYITEGGDKEEFLRKFRNAVSKGFDPDVHLTKLGLANQTTMYKRETKDIGRMFEVAMLKKYGPSKLAEHYAEFDTICDATQERQDAITELVEGGKGDSKIDFVLVVGGFDSSNTAHLKEIPEKYGVPAFHINRASCIKEDNSVLHRLENGELVTATNFLKKGPMTIGITSGASTPDKSLEDAVERMILIHKLL